MSRRGHRGGARGDARGRGGSRGRQSTRRSSLSPQLRRNSLLATGDGEAGRRSRSGSRASRVTVMAPRGAQHSRRSASPTPRLARSSAASAAAATATGRAVSRVRQRPTQIARRRGRRGSLDGSAGESKHLQPDRRRRFSSGGQTSEDGFDGIPGLPAEFAAVAGTQAHAGRGPGRRSHKLEDLHIAPPEAMYEALVQDGVNRFGGFSLCGNKRFWPFEIGLNIGRLFILSVVVMGGLWLHWSHKDTELIILLENGADIGDIDPNKLKLDRTLLYGFYVLGCFVAWHTVIRSIAHHVIRIRESARAYDSAKSKGMQVLRLTGPRPSTDVRKRATAFVGDHVNVPRGIDGRIGQSVCDVAQALIVNGSKSEDQAGQDYVAHMLQRHAMVADVSARTALWQKMCERSVHPHLRQQFEPKKTWGQAFRCRDVTPLSPQERTAAHHRAYQLGYALLAHTHAWNDHQFRDHLVGLVNEIYAPATTPRRRAAAEDELRDALIRLGCVDPIDLLYDGGDRVTRAVAREKVSDVFDEAKNADIDALLGLNGYELTMLFYGLLKGSRKDGEINPQYSYNQGGHPIDRFTALARDLFWHEGLDPDATYCFGRISADPFGSLTMHLRASVILSLHKHCPRAEFRNLVQGLLQDAPQARLVALFNANFQVLATIAPVMPINWQRQFFWHQDLAARTRVCVLHYWLDEPQARQFFQHLFTLPAGMQESRNRACRFAGVIEQNSVVAARTLEKLFDIAVLPLAAFPAARDLSVVQKFVLSRSVSASALKACLAHLPPLRLVTLFHMRPNANAKAWLKWFYHGSENNGRRDLSFLLSLFDDRCNATPVAELACAQMMHALEFAIHGNLAAPLNTPAHSHEHTIAALAKLMVSLPDNARDAHCSTTLLNVPYGRSGLTAPVHHEMQQRLITLYMLVTIGRYSTAYRCNSVRFLARVERLLQHMPNQVADTHWLHPYELAINLSVREGIAPATLDVALRQFNQEIMSEFGQQSRQLWRSLLSFQTQAVAAQTVENAVFARVVTQAEPVGFWVMARMLEGAFAVEHRAHLFQSAAVHAEDEAKAGGPEEPDILDNARPGCLLHDVHHRSGVLNQLGVAALSPVRRQHFLQLVATLMRAHVALVDQLESRIEDRINVAVNVRKLGYVLDSLNALVERLKIFYRRINQRGIDERSSVVQVLRLLQNVFEQHQSDPFNNPAHEAAQVVMLLARMRLNQQNQHSRMQGSRLLLGVAKAFNSANMRRQLYVLLDHTLQGVLSPTGRHGHVFFTQLQTLRAMPLPAVTAAAPLGSANRLLNDENTRQAVTIYGVLIARYYSGYNQNVRRDAIFMHYILWHLYATFSNVLGVDDPKNSDSRALASALAQVAAEANGVTIRVSEIETLLLQNMARYSLSRAPTTVPRMWNGPIKAHEGVIQENPAHVERETVNPLTAQMGAARASDGSGESKDRSRARSGMSSSVGAERVTHAHNMAISIIVGRIRRERERAMRPGMRAKDRGFRLLLDTIGRGADGLPALYPNGECDYNFAQAVLAPSAACAPLPRVEPPSCCCKTICFCKKRPGADSDDEGDAKEAMADIDHDASRWQANPLQRVRRAAPAPRSRSGSGSASSSAHAQRGPSTSVAVAASAVAATTAAATNSVASPAVRRRATTARAQSVTVSPGASRASRQGGVSHYGSVTPSRAQQVVRQASTTEGKREHELQQPLLAPVDPVEQKRSAFDDFVNDVNRLMAENKEANDYAPVLDRIEAYWRHEHVQPQLRNRFESTIAAVFSQPDQFVLMHAVLHLRHGVGVDTLYDSAKRMDEISTNSGLNVQGIDAAQRKILQLASSMCVSYYKQQQMIPVFYVMLGLWAKNPAFYSVEHAERQRTLNFRRMFQRLGWGGADTQVQFFQRLIRDWDMSSRDTANVLLAAFANAYHSKLLLAPVAMAIFHKLETADEQSLPAFFDVLTQAPAEIKDFDVNVNYAAGSSHQVCVDGRSALRNFARGELVPPQDGEVEDLTVRLGLTGMLISQNAAQNVWLEGKVEEGEETESRAVGPYSARVFSLLERIWALFPGLTGKLRETYRSLLGGRDPSTYRDWTSHTLAHAIADHYANGGGDYTEPLKQLIYFSVADFGRDGPDSLERIAMCFQVDGVDLNHVLVQMATFNEEPRTEHTRSRKQAVQHRLLTLFFPYLNSGDQARHCVDLVRALPNIGNRPDPRRTGVMVEALSVKLRALIAATRPTAQGSIVLPTDNDSLLELLYHIALKVRPGVDSVDELIALFDFREHEPVIEFNAGALIRTMSAHEAFDGNAANKTQVIEVLTAMMVQHCCAVNDLQPMGIAASGHYEMTYGNLGSQQQGQDRINKVSEQMQRLLAPLYFQQHATLEAKAQITLPQSARLMRPAGDVYILAGERRNVPTKDWLFLRKAEPITEAGFAFAMMQRFRIHTLAVHAFYILFLKGPANRGYIMPMSASSRRRRQARTAGASATRARPQTAAQARLSVVSRPSARSSLEAAAQRRREQQEQQQLERRETRAFREAHRLGHYDL